jgi:imidazoleglycerol-phosphate dehydratase
VATPLLNAQKPKDAEFALCFFVKGGFN